ncbi:type II secretion system protein GspM [Variovorax sp.]|jgi:general secretion pathway protein M|uniref:type II secretion system protein GspM n=1 Tax=Variovorax sp. TaxID=1871043 RepID=UPI0037DA7428
MKFTEELKARWAVLAMRERRMVIAAVSLVALALLWWIALAPALRTLWAAPAEHARLDAQLQQMATLQNRAKALQSQPRLARDDALRALETSVRQGIGASGQLMTGGGGSGDVATVTLRPTAADALAQWLAQARGNAHAVPREAHLTRAVAATPPPTLGTGAAQAAARDKASEPPQIRWEGTLVMTLPAAR